MSVTELVNGNLKTWHGLSGSETLDSLTQALGPVSSARNDGRRARGQTLFDVFVVERDVRPRAFEAWFRVGENQLTLLETDDPVVHDLTATLAAFGAPDEILEQKRFAMGLIVREHVYVSRGITLSIGDPIPDLDIPEAVTHREVVHLQAYAPRSLGAYLLDIGTGPELRPLPPSFSPSR